jgi:hypothetical protein
MMYCLSFDLDKQKAKRLGLAVNTEPFLIRYLYYNIQGFGGLAFSGMATPLGGYPTILE